MRYSRKHQEKLQRAQLSEILEDYYGINPKEDVSTLVEQLETVERFSLDDNRILCLFSHYDFSIKFISKNVERLVGYSPQEIYNRGMVMFYKLVYWKQLALPIKVFQWGSRYEKISSHMKHLSNGNSYFCGFKIKDKQGKLRTFFIKQEVLSYNKNLKPLLSYMEVEDISNIFKHDVFWARFSVKNGNEICTRVYFNNGQKKEYSELLSIRELEILKLAFKHKNNIEISEILGIAKNTVERHRKNMIARVGVNDMTGLIYICRLIGLI